MDKKQQSREAASQRPKAQEPQKRPRNPAPQQSAEERPRNPAPQQSTGERPRRPAAQGEARRSSAQRGEAPRKRAPQQEEAPRKRTAQQGEATRRSAAQEKPRQGAAQQTKRRSAQDTRQRTARQRHVQPQEEHPAAQRSVQLGGPHMRSARQRTPQEQAKALNQAPVKGTSKQERTLKKNSLQNFIAGIKGEEDEERLASRVAKSEARQKQRAAQAEKRRRQAERDNTPAVIYTQPTAFNRNRLFVQLLTVTAVVLALVLGMSVFFKVGVITVSGAEVYSAWTIREASGIQEGDNLLTFSRGRASAKIQAELPYVNEVRIGIKLPETVIIYIDELSIAYAIKSSDGDWWLINSDGRVVEQVTDSVASNYTQVLGITIADPKVNEDAVATELAPTETDASGEPIPVLVTGSQRLYSALQILRALEANDIVGEAASVDVSILESVVLWYGSRYQVNLGDTSRLEYKIACMNDVILQLSDYQSGILDCSFTIWPNEVGYTPFS